MSKFVIYLKLEKYLSQWLQNSLGKPVVFPAQSNENAIIRRFTQKLPLGVLPEVESEDLTAIVIPDSKSKDPSVYNYMGRIAKKTLVSAIEDLFRMSMWNELNSLVESNAGGVNSLVAAWCEMHGIEIDYVETVRQKYYRMRQAYTRKGIVLQSFSKKSTDDIHDFKQVRTSTHKYEQMRTTTHNCEQVEFSPNKYEHNFRS